MRATTRRTGRYKDQSIGDTPKVYTIAVDGKPTKVVGVGCKNGGFYVLGPTTGGIAGHTPIYTGPPAYPLAPAAGPADARPAELDRRACRPAARPTGDDLHQRNRCPPAGLARRARCERQPPTGGRVVAICAGHAGPSAGGTSGPRSPRSAGPPPKPVYTDVGDPVASGIAVANGVVYFTAVASGKLVALDAATGEVLKEIDLGPVWSGPSVSRGRVYVGTGNTLFSRPITRRSSQEVHRRPLLLRLAGRGRGRPTGIGEIADASWRCAVIRAVVRCGCNRHERMKRRNGAVPSALPASVCQKAVDRVICQVLRGLLGFSLLLTPSTGRSYGCRPRAGSARLSGPFATSTGLPHHEDCDETLAFVGRRIRANRYQRLLLLSAKLIRHRGACATRHRRSIRPRRSCSNYTVVQPQVVQPQYVQPTTYVQPQTACQPVVCQPVCAPCCQ